MVSQKAGETERLPALRLIIGKRLKKDETFLGFRLQKISDNERTRGREGGRHTEREGIKYGENYFLD